MTAAPVSRLEQLDIRRIARVQWGVWSGALICFAAALVIFLVYYVGLKHGQPTLLADTYEYAQVARNVAQGRGLYTNTSTVLEFWLLDHTTLPLPYFFHDAGNSLLLAAFFKLFGAKDPVIGLMSGVFYILLAPLTYLFASRLFSRRIGLLAGLLVAINPEFIVFGTTGYSEVPFAFFLTLLLYLVYTQRRRWMIFLIGILFGAVTILRSNALPALPWFALFLMLDSLDLQSVANNRQAWLRALWEKRGLIVQRLALFLVGFAIPFTPHALHNYAWLHNPLHSIISLYSPIWYTSAIQGKSSSIYSLPGLNIDPVKFLLANPGEIINKMRYQAAFTIPQLLNGGSTYNGNWADSVMLFLFSLSILAPARGETRRQKLFRWLCYALIATSILVGLLLIMRWRYLYGFWPIATIYIAELVWRVLDPGKADRENSISVARKYWAPIAGLLGLLFLLGLPPIVDNIHPDTTQSINNYYYNLAGFVSRHTPANAIVLTQAGSGTMYELENGLTWYSRRQFVQQSDYTYQELTSRPLGRPLFLLVASESYDVPKPVQADPGDLGFVPVASWKDSKGTIGALLFEKK